VAGLLPRGGSHRAWPGLAAPEDVIDLAEAPRPLQSVEGWITYGWRACRFRRVYRPDPGLISRLLRNPITAD
jgi:hypothetical protein